MTVLAWCDLETTGLSPTNCIPLEIAVQLTDVNLNPIADPYHRTVLWNGGELMYYKRMAAPVVIDMHTANGLWEEANAGPSESNLHTLDKELEALFEAHGTDVRIAGNSIRLDLNFLEAYFPLAYRKLNYRSLDMSAVELFLGPMASIATFAPKVVSDHRALGDVQASIAQARYWLDALTNVAYPNG
jgi:oligoribonuclease